MGDGGKGSAPRPKSVELEKFDAAWDKIFGSRKVKVSGVPYKVEDNKLPKEKTQDEGLSNEGGRSNLG